MENSNTGMDPAKNIGVVQASKAILRSDSLSPPAQSKQREQAAVGV